eukprot:jgi/Mesvir1/4178/Mv08894-RA.1
MHQARVPVRSWLGRSLWQNLGQMLSGGGRSSGGRWRGASSHPDGRGVYLYGGTGCGKTMMMDLFYSCCPVRNKARAHFHQFMLEVHARAHVLSKAAGAGDVIPAVAEEIAARSQVLCFDELEVTDVADALLLRRLFEVLLAQGCVIVATSNRRPDDLYKNGLNRQLFVPFIQLVKERCDVIDLESKVDYRVGHKRIARMYIHPLGREASQQMDACFDILTDGTPPGPSVLPVMMGRKLLVPKAARGVCQFSFAKLCGTASALGASDFLALASHYHTLVLEDVPRLTALREGEARRFVNLVDVLYEHKLLLLMSAEVALESLFDDSHVFVDASSKAGAKGTVAAAAVEVEQEGARVGTVPQGPRPVESRVLDQAGASGRSRTMIGDMEWSATGLKGASLAGLAGTSFTFFAAARTTSRLQEMQSANYMLQCGTPGWRLLQAVPWHRGQLPYFRPLQAARQLASRLRGRPDDTDRHGMGATP